MGYKYTQRRWSNVLVLSVLLIIPVVMYAMEQQEEVRIKRAKQADSYGKYL